MNTNLTEINRSQLVARYKELRKIISELQNEDLLKYVTKKAFEVSGRKLGVMKNNTLILDDADQMGVVADYCIYDYREDGLNAVARYKADTQLDPGSEKHAVVKAMSESFYTLVQIENVLPGVGIIIKDLETNNSCSLIWDWAERRKRAWCLPQGF